MRKDTILKYTGKDESTLNMVLCKSECIEHSKYTYYVNFTAF